MVQADSNSLLRYLGLSETEAISKIEAQGYYCTIEDIGAEPFDPYELANDRLVFWVDNTNSKDGVALSVARAQRENKDVRDAKRKYFDCAGDGEC